MTFNNRIARRGAPQLARRIAHGPLGSLIAAGLALGIAAGTGAPAQAAPAFAAPANDLTIAVGRGQMVRPSAPMTDLFVADSSVADVQVRSSTQLYIFGKGPGETTVYATNKAGAVVYSATVRVGTNFDSVGAMLKKAMPDSAIEATPMNGLVLLTGTVATPDDVEQASTLVQAFVGKSAQVVSRLKTATPMQVNLRVKIAEVNRSFAKDIGVNLLTSDSTGGFRFGVARGREGAFTVGEDGTVTATGGGSLGTTLFGSGALLGLDILGSLDLAEDDGLVTTLAEPNLTALSGETASFLAGGEVPIPISQALGTVSVEYKQYGVSLAFTPIVLADGRISMRVRPEVSQLTDAGAVELNGFSIPAFQTRRAETTVELGSGQSFVIGGLLQNSNNNAVNKAPFLGDLPILGALFRSTRFRREETELVIVVTPYLVKPVSANQIALPTDGYKAPTDGERVLLGQTYGGGLGKNMQSPKPVAAPPTVSSGPATSGGAAATPGFSFN